MQKRTLTPLLLALLLFSTLAPASAADPIGITITENQTLSLKTPPAETILTITPDVTELTIAGNHQTIARIQILPSDEDLPLTLILEDLIIGSYAADYPTGIITHRPLRLSIRPNTAEPTGTAHTNEDEPPNAVTIWSSPNTAAIHSDTHAIQVLTRSPATLTLYGKATDATPGRHALYSTQPITLWGDGEVVMQAYGGIETPEALSIEGISLTIASRATAALDHATISSGALSIQGGSVSISLTPSQDTPDNPTAMHCIDASGPITIEGATVSSLLTATAVPASTLRTTGAITLDDAVLQLYPGGETAFAIDAPKSTTISLSNDAQLAVFTTDSCGLTSTGTSNVNLSGASQFSVNATVPITGSWAFHFTETATARTTLSILGQSPSTFFITQQGQSAFRFTPASDTDDTASPRQAVTANPSLIVGVAP